MAAREYTVEFEEQYEVYVSRPRILNTEHY